MLFEHLLIQDAYLIIGLKVSEIMVYDSIVSYATLYIIVIFPYLIARTASYYKLKPIILSYS